MVGKALGRSTKATEVAAQTEAGHRATPPTTTRRSSESLHLRGPRHHGHVQDRLLHAAGQPAAAADRRRHGERTDHRASSASPGSSTARSPPSGLPTSPPTCSSRTPRRTATWPRSRRTHCSVRSPRSRTDTSGVGGQDRSPWACPPRRRWPSLCDGALRPAVASGRRRRVVTVPGPAPGRPARCGGAAGARRRRAGDPAVAIAVVALGSVFVGSRMVGPAVRSRCWTRSHPLQAIAEARFPRTSLALAVGGRTRPRRRTHAGTDPQPVGRPRHPRRQRRCRVRHGAGDLGLRVSRSRARMWFAFAGAAAAASRCTPSPRSAATAPPRSSWPSPALR